MTRWYWLGTRPAAWTATVYALGTAGGLALGGRPSWPLWVMILLPALRMLSPVRDRISPRALRLVWSAAVFALGWLPAMRAIDSMEREQSQWRRIVQSGGIVRLRGKVSERAPPRAATRGEYCHRLTIDKPCLPDLEEPQRFDRSSIRLYWYGPGGEGGLAAAPAVGETWEFSGRIDTPRRAPASVPPAVMFSRLRDSHRTDTAFARARRRVERARRQAADRLTSGTRDHREAETVVQAILLGYRDRIPPRLRKIFRTSGTVHIFAISGLHVMVIAAILAFLMAQVGLPRPLWVVALGPLLLLYVWITGSQPSALRAGLMTLFYLAAPLLNRRPDACNALSLTALFLLIADPLNLKNLGFVFSFSIVLGLILLTDPIAIRLRRWLGLERMAEDLQAMESEAGGTKSQPARRLLWHGGTYVTNLVAVSVVAWLVAAPLTALFFRRFTPAALPANLVVVPLAFVTMSGGALALIAGSFWQPAAQFCTLVTRLAADGIIATAEMAASIPYGSWRLPQPPAWWMILGWYLLLALLAVRLRHSRSG